MINNTHRLSCISCKTLTDGSFLIRHAAVLADVTPLTLAHGDRLVTLAPFVAAAATALTGTVDVRAVDARESPLAMANAVNVADAGAVAVSRASLQLVRGREPRQRVVGVAEE
jgi:hypothetical protein